MVCSPRHFETGTYLAGGWLKAPLAGEYHMTLNRLTVEMDGKADELVVG